MASLSIVTFVATTLMGATAAVAQNTPPPPPPRPMNSGPSPTNGFEYNQYLHDLLSKTRSPAEANSALSKQEQRAVAKIKAALSAGTYDLARAAIDEANATANTKQGRYAIAALQLKLGTDTGELDVQDEAIDTALATGMAPTSLLPTLYRKQGIAAMLANNYAKAEIAFTKVLELSPADAEIMVFLAEAKNKGNKHAEALALFEQAISLNLAANRPVPAEWPHAVSVMRTKLSAEPGQRAPR